MAKQKSNKKYKRSSKINSYQIVGIVFTFLLLILVLLLLMTPAPKQVEKTEVVLGTNSEYWEDIVQQNPTYYPAYLELAKLEVENGNMIAAKEYYQGALIIAPNSEAVKSFEINFED